MQANEDVNLARPIKYGTKSNTAAYDNYKVMVMAIIKLVILG